MFFFLNGNRSNFHKITLLCANPAKDEKYLATVRKLAAKTPGTCETEIIDLNELSVKQCIGCWGCWVKTPGRCVLKDDMEKVLRSVLASDLLIFASPLVDGFISAQLKTAMDRMIPLVHPYIKLYKGECHHRKRYNKYPNLGVLLSSEDGTDKEDMVIAKDIFQRVALNLHAELLFVKLMNHHDTAQVLYESCYL